MQAIPLIRKIPSIRCTAFVLLCLAFSALGVHAETSVTAKILVSVTIVEAPTPPPDNLEEWVVYYFGEDNNFSAESDFDGDGYLDYLEFYAGTDPTDAASKLKITETTLSGNDAIIKWAPTSNGDNTSRKYLIFRGGPNALSALANPQATVQSLRTNSNITELAEVDSDSQGSTTSYTDSNVKSQLPLFYRVILSQPVPQVPEIP